MNGAGLFAHGWLWAYASVFVGGFLTSLTPCVYPLIPITVSLFGARGDDVKRSRAIALASLYVAGICAMYAALGVGSAFAGRAFGTFMANPWVMVPIAGLFVVMAALATTDVEESGRPIEINDRGGEEQGSETDDTFAIDPSD